MVFYGFGFLNFFFISVVLVHGVYFPTKVVNVSLPGWRKLPKPLPPVMKLEVVGEEKAGNVPEVQFSVASETTSGLFVVQGDELRVNEDFFFSGDIISKHQSVTVSGRLGEENLGNSTINLLLSGDKINCERGKRNLCFWAGASYRVLENRRPTRLGRLSSPFHVSLCKGFNISYEIFKGGEYVEAKLEEKTKEWSLSTKKKIGGEKGKIRFGVNCTVSGPKSSETFQREFNLEVLRDGNLQIFFDSAYNVPGSDVIYEKDKVATGIINAPGDGSKLDELKVSLKNDTNGYLDLKCVKKTVESFPKSYYSCEVTARQSIHLAAPYTAYVQIEDTSLPPGSPNRFRFQNISLHPSVSGLEKESLMLSTNSEENFMLGLKYPDSAIVFRRAVTGTRVAEPTLAGSPPNTDMRKQIVASKVKFQVISPEPFNVTESGGIIFVANRHLLKEKVYRIKITGVYPNGYRFFSTMLINVTDPKGGRVDVCDGPGNEKTRASCSEKRSKSECEWTCGVSSGILKRNQEGRPTNSGCVWRSNEKPEKLSRLYQTCSPDLTTCPDRYCDSLEAFFPKSCPQDCTEYVFGSANKENHVPGIASATGVCTCDNRQKCLCFMATDSEIIKQDRKKTKQINNDTAAPLQREVISAIKASYTDQCGTICLLSIVVGTVIFVFGTSAILLVLYRRRLKKRCPNQRPLKEDMVNINYEEYVERPGDILRPLTQSAAIKEIPEYYDKKWEFPRHRLTIEETLGEGEFGKVLKARADGIAGNDGPITVAVKTLKDNAKDSELADLISEYQLLKEIDHPNVIHLLGACTKLDGPVYVIIEYAEHGSLRNYLRKHRHISSDLGGKENETSYVQTITPKDILTFAWQIAKGMNYLTEMKLVHRDLAARNVLVAEGLICKISDFGLTRDIYEDDTYLKRSEGRVPVKWMALESLADHIYTTKSDVWSYGVVLWELVTTGASPYPGIAGQNLFHLLKSGFRMERPPNCSPELYQILRSCWQENPSHRPTFKSLVAKFEEMLGEGKDYLDLNPRTAENKTYFGEFLEDEREAFLPPGKDPGILKFRFEMFENSEKLLECGKCRLEKCACLRYENDTAVRKPKYENEGMEDTGYVQPTGQPKPVEEK